MGINRVPHVVDLILVWFERDSMSSLLVLLKHFIVTQDI